MGSTSQGAKQWPYIFLPFSAVLHGISKSHSTFLKTEKTTFLDLRVFDVFCVFLIDFCGFFAGKVSCFFWLSHQKSVRTSAACIANGPKPLSTNCASWSSQIQNSAPSQTVVHLGCKSPDTFNPKQQRNPKRGFEMELEWIPSRSKSAKGTPPPGQKDRVAAPWIGDAKQKLCS